MTLDEAIKNLEDILQNDPPCWEPDANNALKLGIEALKAVAKIRHYPFPDEILQLPGEDSKPSNPIANSFLKHSKVNIEGE